MADIFTRSFKRFVCAGDKITAEHDGFKLVATVHHDDTSDAPWEREDGHGPVSDWRRKDSKRPGERVLNRDGDHCRFYDFAEACKIALRESWSYGGKYARDHVATAKAEGRTLTLRMVAAEAAERDFKSLKAWCDDDWSYCGIDVRVFRHGIELVDEYTVALWGVEMNYPGTDNAYLTETANELAGQAIEEARANMAKLCTIPARNPSLPRPSNPGRVQAALAVLRALASRHRPAAPSASQGAV